jgi:hypothetical protein
LAFCYTNSEPFFAADSQQQEQEQQKRKCGEEPILHISIESFGERKEENGRITKNTFHVFHGYGYYII